MLDDMIFSLYHVCIVALQNEKRCYNKVLYRNALSPKYFGI